MLGVSIGDIERAFIGWGFEGHRKEHRHEVEPKKIIEIHYDPSVYVLDGTIRLIRPWGKRFRTLDKPIFSFTEEVEI
jgi:hypothetical protein